MTEKALLQAIAECVPMGSRVLDLGCGDGEVLAHLMQHRACTGYGVELNDQKQLRSLQDLSGRRWYQSA